MALSTELRAKILQQARDIDRVSDQISANVASNANRSINTQSAQVASRLDNIINSPSVTAASNQRSAQIANRLNTGDVTSYSGGRQAQIVQAAKDYKSAKAAELVGSTMPKLSPVQTSAQIASRLDNSLMGQATRDKTKTQLESAVESLYNQMEIARSSNNNALFTSAQNNYNLILSRLEEIEKNGGSLVEKATTGSVEQPGFVPLSSAEIHAVGRDAAAWNNRLGAIESRIPALHEQVAAYDRLGMTAEMTAAQEELEKLYAEKEQLERQISSTRQRVNLSEQANRGAEYNALMNADDFEEYAEKGAAVYVPSWQAAEKSMKSVDELTDNPVKYYRDNWDRYVNRQSAADAKDAVLYHYMTDDEFSIYNYLLGKEGKDAANEYLDFIREELNIRAGKAEGEAVNALPGVLKAPTAAAYSVAAGVEQFGRGLQQLTTDERLPTSKHQAASQTIQDDLGKVGKTLYGVGVSVGNMLPSIAISAATGGLGASGAVASAIGSASMGLSSSGNAYNVALQEGYTKEQARTYAALVGGSEATLQYLLGGIGSLGGVTDDVLLAKVAGIDNAFARIAATGAIKIGSEVTEEEIQLLLEPAFRSLIFETDYDAPTWEEAAETAIMTALSTGLLETPGVVMSEVNRQNNVPQTVESVMPTLPEQQNTTQPTGEERVAQAVRDIMGKSEVDEIKTEPSSARVSAEEISEDKPVYNAVDSSNNTILNPPEIVNSQKMEAMGAADYGFSPYSNYQNTQTEFIPEGANASRPVDVPATDPTGKNTRRFASNAIGAQTVPDRAVPTLEGAYMEGRFGYEVKGDKKAVEKANAQVAESYDRAYAQTIERLQSMKNLKQTVVDAEVLISKAYQEGRDADAAELILLLAESGTEFGQAVQAFSVFRKLTPEGQLEGIRRTVKRINEKNAKKSGGMKVAGVTVDEGLAQKFLDAKTESEREAVMEEIYQDIGSKLPTTLGEIANQWRYTAMLLNPSTHAKNIIGSGTQFGMSMIKDALAVPGEALANKISGGKTGRTKAYLNLKSEADQKLLNIAGQYYDAHRDDIMGESQYSNTPEGKINQYKTTMKLNNPQNKVAKAVDAILRGAGKAADWNMDVMDVEDAWFSRPRFQTALAGYMKANGLNEVTDEAYKYAKSEAQKATYRDMNPVSEWASKLGRKTDNPIGKIVRFVINANIPFKKSVANVGVRAVEYSPLGLIKTGTDIAKAAYRKDASAVAGIINDLAANATGSLLYALGIAWAKDGLLRARGAEDDKEREQLKREGYKDNALYVGDVAIPIAFLGAASIPLLLGASTYEAVARANNSEEGLTWQDYISIGASSLDPLAETTMLQGVKDAIETFVGNNPQASLMEAMTFGLMETVGNYFESFVPSVISRTANSLDHAARQTYVEPDSQFPELSKVLQGLQYKIPGARNQMVERVDAYGDTVSGGLPDTGNKLLDVMSAIGNAITPTYPGKIKTTAVDEEMRRLYNVEGLDKDDRTVFISDAPKHFEVGGKEVYLTGDQYEEYQKTRNSSIQQIRDDVMNSDRYDELPDDIKLRAMSDAANYANALAKAGLDVGYKIKTKWMNELAGATPEEVADAIITRSIENAAEDYVGGKYAGLGDMLDSGTIEDKIAISLLPQEQYDRYMKYGKGVPAADLMDALAYKNSDASKGLKDEDGKDIKGETRQDHIEAYLNEKYKGSVNKQIKIGIWCTLYSESTCPWK